MAEPYQIVVGLEVHVQLLTQTKLFCGCRNQFGLPPNSATCPVCLGLPGSLPVMNRQAFQLALRAATALHCRIAPFTKWDRKNYYYPDLPKNYQISQYDLPFSSDGWLEINVHPDPKKGYTPKRIGIIRAHLEEDAGKLLHDESGRGGDTRVDLNRTGTPLLEIVSRPDISSPEEAIAYLEEIRLMMRELRVSDCEMQEGSLRCDANVNIHVPLPDGTVAATPLVEIKNLNSFRSVGRAIKYEAERHYREFQQDPAGFRFGKLLKTTAGWDDDRGRTEVQRHKEEAADYRYFPDPDLVPVSVTAEQIQQAESEVEKKRPSDIRAELRTEYQLDQYDSGALTAAYVELRYKTGLDLLEYFRVTAAKCGDPKAACNWIMNKLLATFNDQETHEGRGFAGVSSDHLAELIRTQKTLKLTKQVAEEVFSLMQVEGLTVPQAMARLGIETSIDEDRLRAAVIAAIAANPKAVEDYKKGKTAAANKIKGEVMKANKGAPNDVVQRLMEEELAKV